MSVMCPGYNPEMEKGTSGETIMYHYWFISCDKCTTQMQNVNNWGILVSGMQHMGNLCTTFAIQYYLCTNFSKMLLILKQ